MDLAGISMLLTPAGWALLGSLPTYDEGATTALGERLRRDGHDPVLPAFVGAAAAIGAALLGARLRGVASQRFGSDKPGAFLEDGIAAALGWLGARRPSV